MCDSPERWYRSLFLLRRFEERAIDLFKEGNLVGGSLHPAIGQEAVAVGVCAALREDDAMTMTYRGRAQFLAKGGDPKRMLAEILGRSDGVCRGKGGPMHLCQMDRGIIGANGIVGAGLPIATGVALAMAREGKGRVCVSFFGDGATNQGAFHEALNLAVVWNAPVVFICENNGYSEMTPIAHSVGVEHLTQRAEGHGVHAMRCDGMDVRSVFGTAREAVAKARGGEGPVFIEAITYRFLGHMVGDSEPYRSSEEVMQWRERDPVAAMRKELASEVAEHIEQEVESLLQEAEAYARQSPLLEPAAIFEDVFST